MVMKVVRGRRDQRTVDVLDVDYGTSHTDVSISSLFMLRSKFLYPPQVYRVQVNKGVVEEHRTREQTRKEEQLLQQVLTPGSCVLVKALVPPRKGVHALDCAVPVQINIFSPSHTQSLPVWEVIQQRLYGQERREQGRERRQEEGGGERHGRTPEKEEERAGDEYPDTPRRRRHSSAGLPTRRRSGSAVFTTARPSSTESKLADQVDKHHVRVSSGWMQGLMKEDNMGQTTKERQSEDAQLSAKSRCTFVDNKLKGFGRGRRPIPSPSSARPGFGGSLRSTVSLERTLGPQRFKQPSSQHDEDERGFLDDTLDMSSDQNEPVFTRTVEFVKPTEGQTPRNYSLPRSVDTSLRLAIDVSSDTASTISSTTTTQSERSWEGVAQRVEIITVRSASEIFLHTADTKRRALHMQRQLQNAFQNMDKRPLGSGGETGKMYAVRLGGIIHRVRLVRQLTEDWMELEMVDTGAIRQVSPSTELWELPVDLRQKGTCLGPCRLTGDYAGDEWLSLDATNQLRALIADAGNVDAVVEKKASRYQVSLRDITNRSLNLQFSQYFNTK